MVKNPKSESLSDASFFVCPLCPGQALHKWCLEGGGKLILDHCPQCSGLWLTSDRLFALRSVPAAFLQRHIPFRYETFVACCAACGRQMSRRASYCSHCQHINALACVQCHQAMDTQFVGGLQQDRCFRDHGFWLDHLAWIQIWDLPERYFEASPFQDGAEDIDWSLVVHQQPSRQRQKQLQKAFAAELTLRRQQGFASDVANAEVAASQAALGSLGVIGFLGKGALKVTWNLFRLLGRLD